MPTLTRRRDPQARLESWRILYGDVQVGTIGIAAGVPTHGDQWTWSCGLPQVRMPGLCTGGSAATFEEARADFEAAWRAYLPLCTDADFERYRRHQAWTSWKYQMHDMGCMLPTATASGRSRCFCGAEIGAAFEEHVYSSHREAA